MIPCSRTVTQNFPKTASDIPRLDEAMTQGNPFHGCMDTTVLLSHVPSPDGFAGRLDDHRLVELNIQQKNISTITLYLKPAPAKFDYTRPKNIVPFWLTVPNDQNSPWSVSNAHVNKQ